VRKGSDETGIVCRFYGEISISFITGKENGLRGQRRAISLNPATCRAVQRPSPKANPLGPKG